MRRQRFIRLLFQGSGAVAIDGISLDGAVVVSRVVTIAQALFAGPDSDPAVARPRASSRLPEFILGPENATARVVIDGLIEALQQDSSSSVGRANRVDCSNIDVQPADEAPNPFERYSPLVLSGPTGCGKSLFVHTLIRAWQQLRPSDSLILTTGADFARDYAEAIDGRQIDTWRAIMRGAALLVIDNLSELAEKQSAQFELLNTLDDLAEAGGLAVVTTRTPLDRCREWLLPGLHGRLLGGMSVALQSPELETRQEILSRFAERRRLAIAPAALRALAHGVRGNVPELFSALMTLESRRSQTRGADIPVCRNHERPEHTADKNVCPTVDIVDVKRYVAEAQETKIPSLKTIALHTARHFTLTVADLKSASRRQAVVIARDVAIYLARQLTNKSLEEVGRFFGGRDHTTVLHGFRKTEQSIKTDPATRQAVEGLQILLATG